MKIVITTKKPVIVPGGQRLPRDVPLDVSDALAKHLLEQGLALPLEVKEAQDRPTGGAGEGTQSSVPPVAQVSMQSRHCPHYRLAKSGAVLRGHRSEHHIPGIP
jgi:hypothetical protein